MKFFEKNALSKPKLILFLVFLFICVSIFSFIIGFQMYLNEENLLKENFKDESFVFYAYFIAVIGLGLFFLYLGKSLLKCKKWSWFFLLGSFFISLIGVMYRLLLILIIIFTEVTEITSETLNMMIINFIYASIYIYLMKYFLDEKIKKLFK